MWERAFRSSIYTLGIAAPILLAPGNTLATSESWPQMGSIRENLLCMRQAVTKEPGITDLHHGIHSASRGLVPFVSWKFSDAQDHEIRFERAGRFGDAAQPYIAVLPNIATANALVSRISRILDKWKSECQISGRLVIGS